MTNKILFTALMFLSASGILSAAAQPLAASYQGFQNWLPVIGAAATLAISLTTMYYFIGVLLNNNKIKGTALTEVQQAIGTVILVMLILALMFMIGSATSLSYSTALSAGPNPVTSQISSICNNVLSHSQVSFLNSSATSINYPKDPPPGVPNYPTLPEPTSAVCSIVNGNSRLDPFTSNLDYGLAGSYVIVANLTNQSIEELNSVYNYDSVMFFLRSIQSYATVCEPSWCAIPAVGALQPREAETTLYYNLYKGYVFHRTIMPTIATQANLSIYLYMSQLALILILLVTWPYLLAAGILLRTFGLTRRAGGLIIAGVIVGTIIYPTLFLFQYSALNNLNAPGCIPMGPPAPGQTVCVPGATNIIGATPSQIPSLALCGVTMNTPTLSGFTNGYSGTTTQFEVYCYTSASTLQLNTIYKGEQPSPTGGDAAVMASYHAMESYCSNAFGIQNNPNVMCACPTGAAQQFSADPSVNYPTSVVAPCFVQKQLSFYVFPNMPSVIRLYSCNPPDFGQPAPFTANDGTNTPDGIIDIEVRIVNSLDAHSVLSVFNSLDELTTLVPGSSLSTVSVNNGVYQVGVPCGIAPFAVTNALEGIINVYGIQSVVGFILPILNILMLLSATFGLSSLMGGETNIIGLSRFI